MKENPYRRYVGVDAGFNTLVRPAMYGAYHEILNASNLGGEVGVYDVYGPLCESGDIFARDRPISEPREGDLLAIMNAGAYGFSMSSQYNSRPRAAEVIVSGGEAKLIRRRESLEDLAAECGLDMDDAIQYPSELSVKTDAIVSLNRHFDGLELPRLEPSNIVRHPP
jgi:hypothetical protein